MGTSAPRPYVSMGASAPCLYILARPAKRELSRRLLELGHKDPAEMARFLDWMTKGTTEELLEKDAPVIVSLGVLLPRDAAAVKPAGKAKTK